MILFVQIGGINPVFLGAPLIILFRLLVNQYSAFEMFSSDCLGVFLSEEKRVHSLPRSASLHA